MRLRFSVFFALIASILLLTGIAAAGESTQYGHSWGPWVELFQADCENEGLSVRTCTVCGAEEYAELPPLGHCFGPWTVISVGGCPNGDGLEQRSCTRCGITERRTVYADNHTWGGWELLQEPSCLLYGLQMRRCTVCGSIQREEMPALGHSPVIDQGLPASCTEAGYTQGSHCERCGQILTAQEQIPALEHTPVWVNGTPATCKSNGCTDWAYCAVCETELKERVELSAFPCPSQGYSDVKPTAWYHDAVDYAISTGFMTGKGGGRFVPGETLTRAELVQVFYNLSGGNQQSGATPFADVPETAWYAKPVAWATEHGIVNGTSAVSFSPKGSASREMVITILFRFAGASPVAANCTAPFSDSESIHKWAYPAVNWAVSMGYVQGSAGRLNPTAYITRAELAQMMMNYLRMN